MKHYYLCAWKHVVRWSEKSECDKNAALYCFRLTQGVTAIDVGESLPEDVSLVYEQLRHLHARNTGNNLLPAKDVTLFPQRPMELCTCDSGKESWIEYSKINRVRLCRVCEDCLPKKLKWINARLLL